MNVPEDLGYTDDHEWVRAEGETAVVGITEFAVEKLGDIVFVELPATGATFGAGDAFGVVESAKAASDLLLPVSGEILEGNAALEDAPELVNDDCYGAGWLVRIRPADAREIEELKDAAAYRELIAPDA